MAKPLKTGNRTPASIALRDIREANWFWIHKDVLDIFTPLIGEQPTLVYIVLCRHCEGREAIVQLSLRQIGGYASLSRVSVWRALRTLAFAGLIVETQPATRREGAFYAITNAARIAQSLTDESRRDLATFVELHRVRTSTKPAPAEEPRNASSVSQGNSDSLLKSPRKSCGEVVENTHISTDFPGTLVFPPGNVSVPVRKHYLNKKVVPKKSTNKTPYIPLSVPETYLLDLRHRLESFAPMINPAPDSTPQPAPEAVSAGVFPEAPDA